VKEEDLVDSPAAATATREHLAVAPDAGGLFTKYSAQILAYCLHNLGSRTDAEDALQTTFLQAHRALQRGVVPQCESAWLTAIAKNACRWQRRTRDRRVTVESANLVDLPAPPDDERQGAVADLKDALALIPERQRRALLLREWQGLRPSEIGPRLGASTSETYALLSRARRSVASSLTAAARRPVLGIDFGSLLLQLKSLLSSAAATVGATAVALSGIGVAGFTVERAVAGHEQVAKARLTVAHTAVGSPHKSLTAQKPRSVRAPAPHGPIAYQEQRSSILARDSRSSMSPPARQTRSRATSPASAPGAAVSAGARPLSTGTSSPLSVVATSTTGAPPSAAPSVPEPTVLLSLGPQPAVATVVSVVAEALPTPNATDSLPALPPSTLPPPSNPTGELAP
jgi:RNA polymerase sigma-70 factor (ECF subfamily)